MTQPFLKIIQVLFIETPCRSVFIKLRCTKTRVFLKPDLNFLKVCQFLFFFIFIIKIGPFLKYFVVVIFGRMERGIFQRLQKNWFKTGFATHVFFLFSIFFQNNQFVDDLNVSFYLYSQLTFSASTFFAPYLH